jgi:uncharacterized protein YcbK (DUF882 family)
MRGKRDQGSGVRDGIVALRRWFLPLFSLFSLLILSSCGHAVYSNHAGSGSMPGAGMEKTRPDPLNARRIVLLHPESGERSDVIYYHDGHYDADAMRRIDKLFRDRHADVIGEIDPELIDYLVDLRTRFNLPSSVTFEILNGYRTAETNAMMSRTNKNVAIESLHVHGWAVDFRIPGVDGQAICEIAKTMQRGGVAYYPKSNHVHIDLGNIRTWKEK